MCHARVPEGGALASVAREQRDYRCVGGHDPVAVDHARLPRPRVGARPNAVPM